MKVLMNVQNRVLLGVTVASILATPLVLIVLILLQPADETTRWSQSILTGQRHRGEDGQGSLLIRGGTGPRSVAYEDGALTPLGIELVIQKSVEEALERNPTLAYAHFLKAQEATKEQDWPTAQLHFEKSLALLKEPNQPLSPAIALLEESNQLWLENTDLTQKEREASEQAFIEAKAEAGKITAQEVEGEALCQLGYVYINLAQKASHSGDDEP